MTAKYVLAALGVAFVGMGSLRGIRSGLSHPQARAWLLVGAIFLAVSAWSFYAR